MQLPYHSHACLKLNQTQYYCQHNNHCRVEQGKWGKWRFIYPIGKETNAEQWVALCRKEIEVKRIRTLWHSLRVRNKFQSETYVWDTSVYSLKALYQSFLHFICERINQIKCTFVGGGGSMLSLEPGGQIGKSGQMLQLSDMTFDDT